MKPGSKVSAEGTENQSVHFCHKLRVLDSQNSSLEYSINRQTIYFIKKYLALPSIFSIWDKNIHTGTQFPRLKLSSQASIWAHLWINRGVKAITNNLLGAPSLNDNKLLQLALHCLRARGGNILQMYKSQILPLISISFLLVFQT